MSSVVQQEDQFQLATYKKMSIVAERGEGVWIYTGDGEKYLDLYGGHAVAALGAALAAVMLEPRSAQPEAELGLATAVEAAA